MKRTFGLLLTIAILVTTVNISAAAFTDTAGTNCETATKVLSALGIVEGKSEGVYEPNSLLTRAEMTTIILRSMQMEAVAEGEAVFEDVLPAHWAYANIAVAHRLGIVNGTSETTFEPDKSVTYAQAVKMVVAALGYSVQAESMGGYPAGYLSKAAQLDLLRGVSGGEEMTRGNMAILLYNALDTELLLQNSFGDNAFDFATDKTKTLLSYYLKITKKTAEITATPMAQFASATHTRRLLGDEVALGPEILKKGETNAQDMLGIRSDIYYRADDEIPEILAIIPRGNVEIADVSAQDIQPQNNTTEFVYLDAADEEHRVGITGATLLYNGREEPMTAALLTPEIGTVRLVSEGSGVDLVIVWEFENYIVENVIAPDCKVYFKGQSTPEIIDFSDTAFPTFMTDAQGAAAELETLARGDVLSVAVSLAHNTSKVRRIFCSNTVISGTVKETGLHEVTIDDVVYPVASAVIGGEIKLGQAAAYALDSFGTVAAVDTSRDTSGIYAWLQNAEMPKGLDAKPQLKLYTQDAEWKVATLAENVLFNGQSRKADSLLDDTSAEAAIWGDNVAPSLVNSDGTVAPQLILYKTNEAGIITEIETAVNLTSLYKTDAEKFGGSFSMDFYQNESRYVRAFDGTKSGVKDDSAYVDDGLQYCGGLVFSRVYVDKDTVMFKIPSDTSSESEYSVNDAISQGLDLEEYRIWACLSYYNIDENEHCGVMVMRYDLLNDVGDINATYPQYSVPSALITKATTVLSENGDVSKAISMINWSGKEITAVIPDSFKYCLYRAANANLDLDPAWYTEKNADGTKIRGNYKSGKTRAGLFMDIDDLLPGDVIQYTVDSAGNLTLASVVHRVNYSGNVEFSMNNGKISTQTTRDNNYRGGNLSLCGTVTKITESGLQVSVNIGNTFGEDTTLNAIRALPQKGTFLIWNSEKQKATMATAASVVLEDYIWSFWQTVNQRMVVIYR